MPERFRGTVYVIVQTDAGGAVDEWPNEGNNLKLFELFVNPWPFADLVVHDVKVPAQAFEGNQVEVRYTVTNRGSGATDKGQWTEQIWLTKDKNRPHPGQGDVLLTSFQYADGVLDVGEGYDRIVTVKLPDSVRSGEYYLTPWVDPYATLLEDTLAINVNPDDPNAVNNNNYKAGGSDLIGFRVIGTPPVIVFPDLTVIAVVAEPQEWAGEPYTISWTVRNDGQGTASGGYDDLTLSDSPVLDAPGAQQFNLGRFNAPMDLAFGQSYTQDQTLILEPAAKGQYLHVRSYVAGDSDRSNDTGSGATDVRDRIPDLRVSAIVPEAQAFSGEKTLVKYTVTNASEHTVWPQTSFWTDQIYLSKDPLWIPDRSRVALLAAVQQANGPLAGGASYSRDVEVTLPPGIEGPYFLYVFTNVDGPNDLPPAPPSPITPFPVTRGDGVFHVGDPYERYLKQAYENPTNNMARATLPVIYREPDLRVTDLQLPDTAAAGTTIDVTFTVTNVGNRETREDSWTDRVFLSFDPSLDSLDAEVASRAAFEAIRSKYGRTDGKLRPGESYTATVQVTVPYDLSGEYQVLAFADANRKGSIWAPISAISPLLRGVESGGGAPFGTVREFQGEGNNVTARPLTVVPYTPPDLKVTALDTNLRAVRGQGFDVAYTVSNSGGATPTQEAAWDDLVYLSRDAFLDTRADRFIGSIRHLGGLEAGASYDVSRRFTVPTDMATEAYYVFVVTDPLRYGQKGEVFEADERNNERASDVPMVIELPPPSDLVVSGITVPSAARSGEPIRLSWTVTNQSDEVASGTWTDSVFLSEDATWDIADRPLGRASFSGTLQPDGSYTLTLDALMPAAAPGNYRVIVRTDIFNQVYEGVNEVNNRAASPNALNVSVDEMQIGAPLTTSLAPKQEKLFQIQVPDGQTLRVTLQSSDPASSQRDLHPPRPRALVRGLRRHLRRPAVQRPGRHRADHRARHLLPAGAQLQRRAGGHRSHAAGRAAAAGDHRRAHRHRRRQQVCHDDDQRRAVPARRDRQAGAPGHRRVRAAGVEGGRLDEDHRHLRLHRCSARPLRPEGHQPRRQRGRRALSLPGRARDRARGDHRPGRPARHPGRRPGHLLGGAAEHQQRRCALHLLRSGRAAAAFQPDRLRLAVPGVLHQRARHARRCGGLGQRRCALGAGRFDHQHGWPALDERLPRTTSRPTASPASASTSSPTPACAKCTSAPSPSSGAR